MERFSKLRVRELEEFSTTPELALYATLTIQGFLNTFTAVTVIRAGYPGILY